MSYTRPFFYAFLFLLPAVQPASAQDIVLSGAAPSVSLSRPVNKNVGLNFLAASKIRVPGQSAHAIAYPQQVLEIYSQGILTVKLGSNWQAAAGYGFQRNNPFDRNWRNEHRLVQQLMQAIPVGNGKLYHRERFEQRWLRYYSGETGFATRARLQVGWIKPLQGERVYWQLNNEVYFPVTGNRYSWISENWLYTGIGFPVQGWGRLETGIGYNTVLINARKDLVNLVLLQVAWSYTFGARLSGQHPVMQSRHF